MSTSQYEVFGYLCADNDGKEKVLLGKNSNKLEFPIYSSGVSRDQVDDVILDSLFKLKTEGVISEKEIIISIKNLPEISKVVVSRESGTFAIFIKIRFEKISESNSSVYCWLDKKSLRDEDFLQPLLWEAIKKDKIMNIFGYSVLECIDALVYKVIDSEPRFLMLQRRKLYNSDFSGWEYPKGGMFFHETPLEACYRELEHETSSTSFVYKGYLGYQISDVRDRKRRYDIVKVHGLTFLFTGVEEEIFPTDEDFYETPSWMTLEEAMKNVWMKGYGPEFFKRWSDSRKSILGSSEG